MTMHVIRPSTGWTDLATNYNYKPKTNSCGKLTTALVSNLKQT